MGRVKGKLRKLMATIDLEDSMTLTGEEEQVTGLKRRARAQKQLNDEIDSGEDDQHLITKQDEENDSEERVASLAAKRKKRKQNLQIKEKKMSAMKDEISENGTRKSKDESIKSKSFRHRGSRRKNKPRRAAEAGVDCW